MERVKRNIIKLQNTNVTLDTDLNNRVQEKCFVAKEHGLEKNPNVNDLVSIIKANSIFKLHSVFKLELFFYTSLFFADQQQDATAITASALHFDKECPSEFKNKCKHLCFVLNGTPTCGCPPGFKEKDRKCEGNY